MNKYVLTYPYSENQEQKEKLEKKVNEANQLWSELNDFGYCIEEIDDPLCIRVAGIGYIPSEWVLGVQNPKSAYCITIECVQNPSVEVYAFEVSEEFFEHYLALLRGFHLAFKISNERYK